jgi:hypothetical protein
MENTRIASSASATASGRTSRQRTALNTPLLPAKSRFHCAYPGFSGSAG